MSNNLYLTLTYESGEFQQMIHVISECSWKNIERYYLRYTRPGRIKHFGNFDSWHMVEARTVDSLSFDELSLLDDAVLIYKDKYGALCESEAEDIKKDIFIKRLAGI